MFRCELHLAIDNTPSILAESCELWLDLGTTDGPMLANSGRARSKYVYISNIELSVASVGQLWQPVAHTCSNSVNMSEAGTGRQRYAQKLFQIRLDTFRHVQWLPENARRSFPTSFVSCLFSWQGLEWRSR